jgi:hypothetical protein
MIDRPYYLVISDHRDGPIIYETMVASMDRATVTRRIAQGQYETVARVVEFKPTAGTCRDVTHEFPRYPPEP